MDKIARLELCDVVTRHVNDMLENHLVTNGQGWINAWCNFGLAWSESEPSHVMFLEDRLKELTRRAAKDPDVHDLAIFACTTRIRAGVTIPSPLNEYVSKLLEESVRRPKRRPGPTNTTWARNFIVISAIREVQRQNDELPVGENAWQSGTRRRKPRISEIVAEGIKRSRMDDLDAATIQMISEKFSQEFYLLMDAYYLSRLNDGELRI